MSKFYERKPSESAQEALIYLAVKFQECREKVIVRKSDFAENYHSILEAIEWAGKEGCELTRVNLKSFLSAKHPNMSPQEIVSNIAILDRVGLRYLSRQADDIAGLMLQFDTEVKSKQNDGKKTYSMDDIGAGKIFSDTYENDLRYVSEWGKWIEWNGKYWETINKEAVRRKAHYVVDEVMMGLYKNIEDKGDAKQDWIRFVHRCRGTYGIDSMIKEATALLVITVNELNIDNMVFNCQNGTIDCRTGELHSHNRNDFITKCSPCSYDAAAKTPIWGAFLERIFRSQSAELIKFIQKAVGYSLTGSTNEHKMFILYGAGSNGKSTFIEALNYVFGVYGSTMQPSVLLSGRNNGGGGNKEDVARLFGIRFATTVETKEGGQFAEEKVKALTGGDRISARRLYENSFEFNPTHKIWMATNHKPIIKGTDEGIWRRLNLIPFTETITGDEKDIHLKDKLIAEADGILAWAVEGLKMWQKDGWLGEVKEVNEATQSYRSESDVFGQFINDVIHTLANEETGGNFYQKYKTWSEENGIGYVANVSFAKKLKERGFISKKTAKSAVWDIQGYRIKNGYEDMKEYEREEDRPF